MIDCGYENFACGGGYLLPAIDYLQMEGVVTNECHPYKGESQYCTYRCSDGGIDKYQKHFCRVGSMHFAWRRDDIKEELYRNGPMMMGLTIYEDFMNYGGGVYKHVAGGEISGHAMKVVGYGTDATEGFYWVLQN
jgi:cathepsin B